MKKLYYIKAIAFVLCLCSLFTLSVFGVSAEEETEEYKPIEWKMDVNLSCIYGDSKRYDRYYANGAFYGDARKTFEFTNMPMYDGLGRHVYGDSADPHIISVRQGNGYSWIFTDDEGREILNSFVAQEECIYYLENFSEYVYTVIDRDIVRGLKIKYESRMNSLKQVSVAELSEADIYEITVHDITETKAFQQGAVYVMPDGMYYYVCFENLPNSYFDADGYFSYRSGTVPVYVLDGTERTKTDRLIKEMVEKESKKIYEDMVILGVYDIYGNPIEESEDPMAAVTAVVLFILMTVFAGVIVPIGLLIMGLLLSRSKKTGNARCWEAVAASSVIWMVSAVAFLLLVVV